MLKFLFKTSAYYIVWQKFKRQIVLVLCSIILIGLIGIIYNDLFEVLKVTNKEGIAILLFLKWFLILIIIGFNIYILRRTKIDLNINNEIKKNKKNFSEKEKSILKKKEILSSTDLLLKKYKKI